MQGTRHPRVKICCIANGDEAKLAIRYGASALGLVSEMPSGPGVIPEESIAAIAAATPPAVATFLLTCKQDIPSIIMQQRRCGTNTIQICDRITSGCCRELRQNLPGIKLVQVIHVTGPESVDEAAVASEEADAILLDSGNPSLAIKELGGTGRRHDWKVSRQIREQINIPLFLAGGLKAENVRQAIEEVEPFAIDICTGVRTDGKLDEQNWMHCSARCAS